MTDDGPLGRLDGGDDGEDNEDDEWRFSVDEVGPEGAVEADDDPEPEPLEPEAVSAENAAFVIAGAALTVGIILTAL